MTEPPTVTGHSGSPLAVLTKKVGPLPGYAWVLLIVVAAYLYRRYRSKSTPTPLTGSGVATDALSTDPSASVGGAGYTGGGGVTQTPVVTQTNAQWGSRVTAGLVGQGLSPADVSNAVTNYLNGKALTAAQGAIINKAIQQYGPPPEGVLPITITTPAIPLPVKAPVKAPPHPVPVPVHPPAPKPAPRRYTVKGGDTLSSIASHFYGSPDWQKIYNANKAAIGPNPNLIHPGLVLVIPS